MIFEKDIENQLTVKNKFESFLLTRSLFISEGIKYRQSCFSDFYFFIGLNQVVSS